MDNYWSTVVAVVAVVTVSAAVLPDAGWRNAAAAAVWRACARSARPGTGQPLTLGSTQQCAAAGPSRSSDTVIVSRSSTDPGQHYDNTGGKHVSGVGRCLIGFTC